MKREEFERQLQQLVPRLDGKTTEAWYRYGLEMCGEFSYDFLERFSEIATKEQIR